MTHIDFPHRPRALLLLQNETATPRDLQGGPKKSKPLSRIIIKSY